MLQQGSVRQRLASAPAWTKYCLSALAGGVIGNAGYALLMKSLGRAISIGGLIPLTWFLVVIEAVLLALLLYFVRQQDAQLTRIEATLAQADLDGTFAANTVKLDENLLPLLSALVQAPAYERDTTLERLLYNLLQDLTEVIDAVSRGTLLRREDDYLVPWISSEMPGGHLTGLRFYVGNDHSRIRERGVAGVAFETRQLQTVHVFQHAGEWRGDHDAYIPPNAPRRRPR